MSSRDKFSIKSGRGSSNYQAGRDINQNFGSIIQTIAQSRLARVAAIMTIVAGIIAVAQYASSLPANFKLASVSFKYIHDSDKNGFWLVMQNQGPDNIRDLNWYVWLDGQSSSLENILRGSKSIVARGDMYVVRHIGEGKLPARFGDDILAKAKEVNLCMIYDGPFPGTKQWMLLSGTVQSIGGYYSGSLTGIGGVPLTTVNTGGGLSLFSHRCSST